MHYGPWEEGGPCPDLADLSPSMAAGAVSPLPPFRDVHWAEPSSPWQAFGCPSEPVRPCWPWPSCSPHSESAELCSRRASRSGPAKPVPLPCLLCLHPGWMARAAGSDGRCCQTPETDPGWAEGPLLPGEDKRDCSRAGGSASSFRAFLSSAAMAFAHLCCPRAGERCGRGEPSSPCDSPTLP